MLQQHKSFINLTFYFSFVLLHLPTAEIICTSKSETKENIDMLHEHILLFTDTKYDTLLKLN